MGGRDHSIECETCGEMHGGWKIPDHKVRATRKKSPRRKEKRKSRGK